MIGWLSNWAQGIIIAVIIATIIEMILPKSSLKKYIKVVIGIYILFTIVSPVANKFSKENISINDVIDVNKYTETIEESNTRIRKQLDSNNSRTIKDIYIENLETDIRSRLKQKNVEAGNIYIKANDESPYMVTELRVYLNDTDTNESNEEKEYETSINKVNIEVEDIKINSEDINNTEKIQNREETSNLKKEEIKKYLADIYSLNTNIIFIM